MIEVRITEIENGYTVYDSHSCKETFYKSLTAALKKVRDILK